jgi:endoglucanase
MIKSLLKLGKSGIVLGCILLSAASLKGQTGLKYYFPDLTSWAFGTGYAGANPNPGEMRVDASGIGGPNKYDTYSFGFKTVDMSNYPYLQVKIRTAQALKIRIDLVDSTGNVTNAIATTVSVAGVNSYSSFTFDFSNKFSQTYPPPNTVPVNASKISRIIFYFNPGTGSPYTGSVFFDSLRIGSACNIPPIPKAIKFNQIGFYPTGPKMAIAAQAIKDTFYIISASKMDTLYKGKLSPATKWVYSNEMVKKANFTTFKKPGTYFISLDSGYSIPFTIAPNVHLNLAKGLLKSYYYNRASIAIVAPWGGKWLRAAGHPDNVVKVDPSAATAETPAGTIFSSPRGWYDAGDYNKYVVNAGITTYTILSLYEHFPAYFDTLNTFIPESKNNIPDILDEALWEVRWLFTAQDPKDGAVYHKITSPRFDGTEMPANDYLERLGVYKGTAAALDFTAVMAQASRIFSKFDKAGLPGLADSCMNAALKAFSWASHNPNVTVLGNPSNISTGTYSDNNLTDEFSWARMELYATTRNDNYYKQSDLGVYFGAPSYSNVNSLGLMTLVNYRKRLNTQGYIDTTTMRSQLLNLADGYVQYSKTSPYAVVAGQSTYDFNWGSNSILGNQGLILLQAFRLTKDSTYLTAALSNLDYILGRNGTGYSFVTGFGYKSTMNPHHRISTADGVADPIPGMVVGGPNPGQNDPCPGYPSALPGLSYLDTECSYSTNEPAINYTAPVAYMAGAVEAIYSGVSFTPAYSTPPPPSALGIQNLNGGSLNFTVYPNPANAEIMLDFNGNSVSKISIQDATGHTVLSENNIDKSRDSKNIDVRSLAPGFYIITLVTNDFSATKKLIIQ